MGVLIPTFRFFCLGLQGQKNFFSLLSLLQTQCIFLLFLWYSVYIFVVLLSHNFVSFKHLPLPLVHLIALSLHESKWRRSSYICCVTFLCYARDTNIFYKLTYQSKKWVEIERGGKRGGERWKSRYWQISVFCDGFGVRLFLYARMY